MRGVKKLQSARVGGRQFCTQLSIFKGSLAEVLLFFDVVKFKMEEVSQNCLADLLRFGAARIHSLRKPRRLAAFQISR